MSLIIRSNQRCKDLVAHCCFDAFDHVFDVLDVVRNLFIRFPLKKLLKSQKANRPSSRLQ